LPVIPVFQFGLRIKNDPQEGCKRETAMKLGKNHRLENERATPILHLKIGDQIFHNGLPVRLLYRIHYDNDRETWRVRPLFVQTPDRNEQFHRSDIISFLHTKSVPGWICAA
jgi:hypothetical protein